MNRLTLIPLPKHSIRGHGGVREQRRCQLRINGVVVDEFTENSALNNYASGTEFDTLVEDRIRTYETALNCKVTRQGSPSTTKASMTDRFADLLVKQLQNTLDRGEQEELAHIKQSLKEIEHRAFAATRRR